MSLPHRRTVDGTGMLRQCAWCWTVADASGAYILPTPGRIGEGVTHGICPSCRAALLLELDARVPVR